jgi:hypothetical protein
MKKYFPYIIAAFIGIGLTGYGQSSPAKGDLKVVFIRHGEKPEKGSNLTCKGLNRSKMLPALIAKKFGVPDFLYVPSLGLGEKTKHARMFETVIPLAVKYNLDIDSKYEEHDSTGIANDIMQKKGTVLITWEHKAINGILHALSAKFNVKYDFKWNDDDYDTILIVTIKDGKAVLTKDSEGLNPGEECE